MFGLMRKLISKPFVDTEEKRDQMEKLVCNMIDGNWPTFKDNESESKKFNDKVDALVDSAPTLGRPVWRSHNNFDFPSDAIEVAFSNGQTSAVKDGVCFMPLQPRSKHCYPIVAYHAGEYVRRVGCQKCEGTGAEIESTRSQLGPNGWFRMETNYTGARCRNCKGKGYTLERFKR